MVKESEAALNYAWDLFQKRNCRSVINSLLSSYANDFFVAGLFLLGLPEGSQAHKHVML